MSNDFDIAALNYDISFTFSNIGKAQRSMIYKYLYPIINNGSKLSILELNCGTGEDAIQFARLGHKVLATDISAGMIDMAKAKTSSEQLKFKIQDINKLSKNSFDERFDLIFSNFGGFNCLSKLELKDFFKVSTELLKPNGKIILVIMPKQCLWEQFYFKFKGKSDLSSRRNNSDYVLANVDGEDVKTWYHNPNEIIALAEKDYTINTIKPIGLSIPPSYLEDSIFTNRLTISVYKGIDSLLTSSSLAKYADHFLIEMTKS